jgi:hypothetical protein
MHGTTRRASAASRVAYGRDAADVAISTTFGANTLTGFQVFTDEIVPAEVKPRVPA